MVYAQLDIQISHQEGSKYAVHLFYHCQNPRAKHRLTQGPVSVHLDVEALNAKRDDLHLYGLELGRVFFEDPELLAAFKAGEARAKTMDLVLQVRLCLAPDAGHLHGLLWEYLLEPGKKTPLFCLGNHLFVRFHDGQEKSMPDVSVNELKALAVLANPVHSDTDELFPINLVAERMRAEKVLAGIPIRFFDKPGDVGLNNLIKEMRRKPEVLYLVCHGSLENGEPMLWLENQDGSVDMVHADDFAHTLGTGPTLPRLVVLLPLSRGDGFGSCEASGGMGMRLVAAGVPAVLSMQGPISEDNLARFLSGFFGKMQEHGFLAEALSYARKTLENQKEWGLPVLFSSWGEEALWAGEQEKPVLDFHEEVETGDTTQPMVISAPRDSDGYVGSMIGPYRLQQILGSGGMGVVYHGARDDGELSMTAAIKLLKRNKANPRLIARFRRERQLLADLRHPNISQLLDAGTHDGLPYFIMEYVDGITVDHWCMKLGFDQRPLLVLFCKVLDAVGLAHRKGVIHRDIKPANVLVRPDDEPILLDFGIAHTMDAGDTDEVITKIGRVAMTPSYAAPEQIRGDAATPKFDVYALGILLLEMLTGRRVRHDELTALEMVEAFVKDPNGRPPEACPPEVRHLSDELAQILVTALAELPSKRYGTCEQFADDIQRFLKRLDEPSAEMISLKGADALMLAHQEDLQLALDLVDSLKDRDVNIRLETTTADPNLMAVTLTQVRSCLACVGPGGPGPWMEEDLKDLLGQRVKRGNITVLPMLLPGARRPARETELPFFMRRRAWLRCPSDPFDPNPVEHLLAQIFGRESNFGENEDVGECPFRGLEVFREQDVRYFFGRESMTQRLVEHMERFRFLAVLGPSGSGKSSVVQAGLMPWLRKQGYGLALFTPARAPLVELALNLHAMFAEFGSPPPSEQLNRRLMQDDRALHFILRELHEAGGANRICLVIDQLEEIFTLARNQDEVNHFLANLIYAIEQPDDPLSVVCTLRSDFLGKCVSYPDLDDYLTEHMVQVKPMTREESARAVAEPAHIAGLAFEHNLLDEILDDLAGEAGELPLLEHALLELYEHRRNRLLTMEAYREIGGIEGALARRAESTYQALDEDGQAILRKMFTLCLVNPGEGAEDTRRRATREELLAVGGQEELTASLLDRLIEARLLTSYRDEVRNTNQVDVAHEALIRKWGRIKAWMAEDRETARLLRRLRRQADAWIQADRDSDFLLRGAPLLQMIDLVAVEGSNVGEQELAFVEAGEHLREIEKRAERKRLQLGIAGALATTVITFMMFLWANSAKKDALEAEQHIRAEKARGEFKTLEANYNLSIAFNEKVGIALANDDPEEAWLGSLAALSLEVPADKELPGPRGRFMDGRMDKVDQLLWTSPVSNTLASVATSPDGSMLALAGKDSLIRLIDVDTGLQTELLTEATLAITEMAFSPNGQWLAAASERRIVYLWHLEDSSFHALNYGHQGLITCVVFSPDSLTLASGDENGGLIVSSVLEEGSPKIMSLGNKVNDLVYSQSSEFLFAGLTTGLKRVQPDLGIQEYIDDSLGTLGFNILAVTRSYLVAARADTKVSFHDLNSGEEVKAVAGHDLPVNVLAGRNDRLVSISDDKQLIWNLADFSFTDAEHLEDVSQGVLTTEGHLNGMVKSGLLFRHDLTGHKHLATPAGHSNIVWSVAYSPNGQWVASASWDGSVYLWDVAGKNPPRSLQGRFSRVYGSAFSPDGRHLASTYQDGSVRVWLVEDGSLRYECRGHEDRVYSVAFSPDGRFLTSGSSDRTVRLWALPDESESDTYPLEITPFQTLEGHTDRVLDVAFSPDGQYIASSSRDRNVILWRFSNDTKQASPSTTLTGHQGRVYGLSFSPDSRRLASASYDQTVRVWSLVDKPRLQHVLEGHTEHVMDVAFSPDGLQLASSSDDRSIRIWSVPDGLDRPETRQVLRGHFGSVLNVSYSPDGKQLASGSADYTVRFWDMAAEPKQHVLRGHEERIYSVDFSPDGQTLVSGSADQMVKVWERSGFTESDPDPSYTLYRAGSAVQYVRFSPDGGTLAVAASPPVVLEVSRGAQDEMTSKVLATLEGHQAPVIDIEYHPNGRHLVTGSYDGTVQVFRSPQRGDTTERLKASHVLKGHRARVLGVAVSPNGRWLASVGDDQQVRIWAFPTESDSSDSQKPLQILDGHASAIVGVDFSPDNAFLATSSVDKTIRLWSLVQKDEGSSEVEVVPMHVMRGHSGIVLGVTFSPDGRWLASSSADHTTTLWRVSDGRPIAILRGHEEDVNLGLTFSPDGGYLATPSDDKTIRLWRMEKMLLPPQGQIPRVWYGSLLERSLYHMAYRLDGFRLIHQPHFRLYGGDIPLEKTPFNHLDQPRPQKMDYADWLMNSGQNP